MGSDARGALDVPAGLANGMLGLFLHKLLAGRFESVRIVAFIPKPRFLDVLLGPAFDVHGDGSCSVMERWVGSENEGR